MNRYNASTGELTNLASGSRVWTGTKAAYDAQKAAGTLPTNAIICITDDEVDTCHYSTEETFTGMYWIDGKKIYRKVFIGSASNGTTINHNISNLNEVINIDGTVKDSSMWYPLTNYDQGYYTRPSIDTTKIWWVMQYFSNISYILVLEYTKTTD